MTNCVFIDYKIKTTNLKKYELMLRKELFLKIQYFNVALIKIYPLMHNKEVFGLHKFDKTLITRRNNVLQFPCRQKSDFSYYKFMSTDILFAYNIM